MIEHNAEPAWKWLAAVNDYVRAGYLPHASEYEMALLIRAFAKWWLEFCRNFIVVVAINYFAQKSGSLPLIAFAWFIYFVFFAFICSYFGNFAFYFFPYIHRPLLKFAVNATLWLVIYTCVFIGSMSAFHLAYEGLLAAQVR